MSYYIDYAQINPSVLEALITSKVMNAFCLWEDLDGETFNFKVCCWFPLTLDEVVTIEKILAPYM